MQTIQSRASVETVAATFRMPRALRDDLKIQAIRAGRSLNTHVVMILGEAAGEELGGIAPAAGSEAAAR